MKLHSSASVNGSTMLKVIPLLLWLWLWVFM